MQKVLIYSHKITPRLTYVFKHIFVRILNAQVQFTTDLEEFMAFEGVKINYSKVVIKDTFFVRCNDLLFEQRINDIEISIQKWEEVPCFFPAGTKSSIPFDIFAASFYLVSRYEEYIPHVKDELERFPAEESVAFKNGFLEKPVIDIWAYKLRSALENYFPNCDFVSRKYQYISTFVVNQAFIYKHKGFVRSIGGIVTDLISLDLLAVIERILVLIKVKKDPYDTYNEIIEIQKKHKIETFFFFLIANYTTYDTNISITKNSYRLLIKSISDYVTVGLNASSFTMKDEDLLKKELIKMESIINTPVLKTRQHLLRIDFPETYQNLIDLEVAEDYSMRYSNYLGFRASTCTPFYFYDLDFEIQTPLKIIPISVTDLALQNGLHLSPRQALVKVKELYEEVKKVDGTFVSAFHNELLSNYDAWRGWHHFYEEMLEIVKE